MADRVPQLQAKAVMERDLSRIRQRRAERERLRAPTKPVSPPKQSPVQLETETKTLAGQELQKEPPNQGDKARLHQDVVMADPANLQNTQSSATLRSDGASKADDRDQAISSLEGMPQDSQNTTGLAISMPNDSVLKEHEPPNDNGGIATHLDISENPTGDGNAPTGQAKNVDDFDFESMFNDSNMMPQNGTMDLDFDFSNTDAGTQNTLADNPLDGMVLSNEDLSKAIPATNEDLDTLLPGLDSYVNANGETAANSQVSNINPPPHDAAQANQDSNIPNTTTTALGEQPIVEPNFDDFFNPADFNTAVGTSSNGNNVNNTKPTTTFWAMARSETSRSSVMIGSPTCN